ncbi:gem-associated protein 6-like [Xenia sp. Carnegie-2017]|uniref:gem-associated protein 6-like n=1 Tax=Xenia sp. Carnegie-2017 TaxID=2897299 RepID=UPI001F03C1DC|nr:gem-associated protein 6-like [Xenia sp. Carnegie-2017]
MATVERKTIENIRQISPEMLAQLINCFVHITLEEKEELSGWICTIDPVSYTIVIAKDLKGSHEENKSVVFVMEKAVKQIYVVGKVGNEPSWVKNFAFKKKANHTDEELRKRKEKLIKWLEKNRVPILADSAETENIRVVGSLVIEPPYDENSCEGTNEIVLARIRKLLCSMPIE